ncbi:VanW family protein [Ferruginibacter sp. SUN106]|uniref:VanW family protein n=1 Tax=Ferruginibacter sp. SUN106 TaxID=2978348 RepID=UPI003D365530
MLRLKKYIPAPVKLLLQLQRRAAADFLNGYSKLFCSNKNIRQQLPENIQQAVSIQQQVKVNDSSANKISNLNLAITTINNIEIAPGQIFSFWKSVGNPSEKNGYKKSRTIINGELEAATGGGLCQLSGLIYFLSVQTGLTVLERHPHSIDIYKDEDRFTPLGSDATVAYGYKDCRIKNEYHFPVYFSFTLNENSLTGIVSAAENILLHKIEFEYEKHPGFIKVKTLSSCNGLQEVIASHNYNLLQ